jgi:ribosomal protein S12 methylthiotransferase
VSARTKKSRKAPRQGEVRTVSLVSLGCPKNLVDSEKMLGLLAEAGLTPVSSQEENFSGADAVVINTCGFLEASKDESLGVIKEAVAAKEAGDVRRVIVAGCLVQRHRAKMLEWAPGIDAMVGVFDRDKIVEAVMGQSLIAPGAKADRNSPRGGEVPNYWIAGNALVAAGARGMKTTGLTVNGKDGKGVGYFEDDSSRLRLTPRHYAYLRISEGCNQNCAFCTIPSIRGKMRSKGPDRVVAEARELLHDGAFELLLIGQDTTSYGDDIGLGSLPPGGRAGEGLANVNGAQRAESQPLPIPSPQRVGFGLPGLLRQLSSAVDDVAGAGWLRLMYAYPSNFSDETIDAFGELVRTGRLIPYLDIPLQHASDRMLSVMRRNVTREKQRRVVSRLTERVPGMAIRTTFISGFPGETEQDHRELLDFIEEMKFENVGVFAYSHEDGTPAGTMEDDPKLRVPEEVKERRRAEVMEAQQRIVFARNKALAAEFDDRQPLTRAGKVRGEVRDVLIDAALRTRNKKTTGVTEGGRLYQGRTTAQAPQIDGVTYVQSKEKLSPGELVRCVVVGWDGYDLVARPVAELEKRVGLNILNNGC